MLFSTLANARLKARLALKRSSHLGIDSPANLAWLCQLASDQILAGFQGLGIFRSSVSLRVVQDGLRASLANMTTSRLHFLCVYITNFPVTQTSSALVVYARFDRISPANY